MVEAKIVFKDGSAKSLWVKDFNELIERMKSYDNIVRFNACTTSISSMRQGRYRGEEND